MLLVLITSVCSEGSEDPVHRLSVDRALEACLQEVWKYMEENLDSQSHWLAAYACLKRDFLYL